MTEPLPFAGNSRFQVRRCLGAGGFGTVYEALDRKLNALIALKVLRRASPDDIYRFKQEFRSLCGLTHRNLVTLYELLAEADQWFFSMELVPGSDFVTYHRGAGGHDATLARLTADDSSLPLGQTVDASEATRGPESLAAGDDPQIEPQERVFATPSQPTRISTEQLLRSLRQLAEGLMFLHDQGFIHRDIKPANVLCTSTGRVVLLDFGLAQEITAGFGWREPLAVGIAGTPDYMSPEQALAQTATTAADWYSVGTLIYEVITGRTPFSGTVSQVLRQKVAHEPPPLPPLHHSVIPNELQQLCMRLLDRRPELRPDGAAVIACLRELETKLGLFPGAPESREERPREKVLFIGRQRQLEALAESFAASRQGKTVVALCHGESGAGKSALCKQFLKDLVAREPELLILSGRCYAHEDVPFKALDGVVDSLSRFLRHRPASELEALLPRDIPAAARLFPVLLQVAAIKDAPPRRIAEDLQVKQVAALALRELVLRLSQQRPVVLYIDDLQWGDRDGISLLLELLRPPDPPRLLLIVAYRSDEEKSSAALENLRNGLFGQLEQSLVVTEIPVDALSPQEAESLAERLLPPAARERVAVIAAESGGNPFFVTELSRTDLDAAAVSPSGGSQPITRSMLDGLIRARVERLPQAPRKLLSFVAIAGQPISRAATALAAYENQEGTDEPQALALLRAEHLLRVRHTQPGGKGEAPREELLVYHDRIREAVVAGLPPADVSAHHLRLAHALEACSHVEPEQMVFHLQQGGDLDGAARYAIQASAQAYHALSYNQAVRLCRAALSSGRLTPADELLIKTRLADALVGAGHPKEAAETYLELAERERSELAFIRRRQAAKQFFISGHVKQGYEVIEGLLPAARLRIPKSSLGHLASLAAHQLLLTASGMEFRERREAEIPAADLLRIDTCEAIASTTGVDPLLAANFTLQFLWYALRAGEPRRIVVALSFAAGLLFAFGTSSARIEKLLARAERLAERLQYSYGSGRCIFIRAHIAYLSGRFREAVSGLRHTVEVLKSDPADATALIDYCGTVEILSLRCMGVFQALAEKVPPYLKEATERGRKSQELSVRMSGGFLLLLRDDAPERAEAFVTAAQAQIRQEMSLTHYFALDAQLMVLLYQGRTQEAWRVFSENRQKIERTGLLRMDFVSALWQGLCGLVALATGQPLRLAGLAALRLLRRQCVFAAPLSKLILALARKRQGRLAEALSLIQEAEVGLSACDMELHVACIRFRRAQWLTGAAAEEPRRLALAWMAGQGVRNPERMAAMLVPDSP